MPRLSSIFVSIVLVMCLAFLVFVDDIGKLVVDFKAKETVSKYNQLLSMPFDQVFKDYYSIQLDDSSKRKRGEGFAKIFSLAQEQNSRTNKPIIVVETGSMRKSSFRFSGDGSSTLIFNHFVDATKGVVYTVDLDFMCKEIIENIYKLKNTHSYTMDSVEYLRNFPNPQDITILYLDSYDVDFNNPAPSAEHHLKEIEVVFDKLTPGTIIVVDDNKVIDGVPRGKGYLVENFLKDKNTKLVYDGYIKVFQIQPILFVFQVPDFKNFMTCAAHLLSIGSAARHLFLKPGFLKYFEYSS